MLPEFSIEQKDQSLTITLSKYGSIKRLVLDSITLVVAFIIVLSFPKEKLIGISEFWALIYLLPLLLVPGLYKRVRQVIRDEVFHFDEKLNECSHNGTRKCRLDDIHSVLISYKKGNDTDEMFLDLRLLNSGIIRISDSGSKKSYIETGLSIAKFLKVAFVDDFPYGKEVLWGKAAVDKGQIDLLNEHLKE